MSAPLKIVVLDRLNLGTDLDLSPLDECGQVTVYEATTPESLISHAAEADVLVSNRVRFDARVFDNLPRLKLIALTATGTNQVDLEEAQSRGIAVTNVVGYSTESVAQHTFALALAAEERICAYNRYVQQKDFVGRPTFTVFHHPYREWQGKRWGIIGLGAIGRAVARIAAAFGCEVSWTSTSGVSRTEDWPQIDLATLLQQSDIISIHAPINEQTRGLIGMQELSAMKADAILVNVGRGGIIDEAALAKAVDEGEIRGAGIDVFESEPPREDNPLLHVQKPEHLVLTPHTAWSTIEARMRLIREVADNIKAFVAGETRNRV